MAFQTALAAAKLASSGVITAPAMEFRNVAQADANALSGVLRFSVTGAPSMR
jgi:hypothetical protein